MKVIDSNIVKKQQFKALENCLENIDKCLFLYLMKIYHDLGCLCQYPDDYGINISNLKRLALLGFSYKYPFEGCFCRIYVEALPSGLG